MKKIISLFLALMLTVPVVTGAAVGDEGDITALEGEITRENSYIRFG